eukprot:gb/GECG01009018.1/.p1 GENE.gb/GECG01009018.1/~~gb/GECG01009018.1/.p1  ORF type:complete len:345 (+),score=24.77 gb/GECG01009018.1/:1-1035(+)
MCSFAKCMTIFLSVVNTVFHVAFLVAPTWFFCSFGPFGDTTTVVYGLFYVVVSAPSEGDYSYTSDTSVEKLDFFPQSGPVGEAHVTLRLFTIVKLQMITSVILWLRMLYLFCTEAKLNTVRNKITWKLFVVNWFSAGFLAFIIQFMGFAGSDLEDCQAFLAAYFSMLLSLVNLAVINNISTQFSKDENPYVEGSSMAQNPIGSRNEFGTGNIQMSVLQASGGRGNHALRNTTAHRQDNVGNGIDSLLRQARANDVRSADRIQEAFNRVAISSSAQGQPTPTDGVFQYQQGDMSGNYNTPAESVVGTFSSPSWDSYGEPPAAPRMEHHHTTNSSSVAEPPPSYYV